LPIGSRLSVKLHSQNVVYFDTMTTLFFLDFCFFVLFQGEAHKSASDHYQEFKMREFERESAMSMKLAESQLRAAEVIVFTYIV
jgi:hypothetical protein